ncbi:MULTISPECIES: Cof-type HAD-IIB family hydrolase [Brevibacillus]|uniref:Cof-type HAD-IIB family hydrolase n=1 Tax=Brevibacillus brevis TaxID=1393 RepID=A0A2Z4MGL1_BREBE|nr:MULTISPECIES: Cof-type HAD-IIB family hydrolase [Brevibacillus]AWX55559.1 Cof-type HAD-IIB family hydrolase [Brevibacillus brevis]NRR20097.1 Cof-type HAD-IIB family hydrolase [Brevibacillus sp. MS2.2]
MAYQIVFFDIDGTLLNTDHIIPQTTVDAVQTLKQNGVHVAIATGRAPYHLMPIAEQLGIETFVGFNGSYVKSEGKIIHHTPIATDTLATLEQMAEGHSHPMVFLSAEHCYANAMDHPHIIESFDWLRLESPAYRHRYWEETPIYQAFLYCGADESRYTGEFHDVSYIRWHEHCMDILPPNGSKAKGIEAVLKHFGLTPADAVAFGDGLNDKEMLSYVGMGVAMGNAHEELKPFANMITRHVNDSGIQHGLAKLGLI